MDETSAAHVELAATDVTSSAFKARAFAFWRELRARAPVLPVRLPAKQTIWLVSRYDDVAAALKDVRLVKDRRNVPGRGVTRFAPRLPGALGAIERNMLDRDPPDHARLRALVQKAFTSRRIGAMESRIAELARERSRAAVHAGRIELVGDLARPIPVTVISEMLGIPDADRARFARWSNTIVAASSSRHPIVALPAIWRFVRMLRRVLEEKRARPADDLLSALVQAEEEGERLDRDELVAMAFLLVVAGHETTVHLIANGALALLRHPEQLERLRAEPTLWPNAVEEVLRYYGPVEVATERYARESFAIAGREVPRGALVGAVLASAGRDESAFEQPEAFDVSRTDNRHLAFGTGPHFCLGAPLARLESSVVLRTLFEEAPNLELAVPPGELRWRRGLNLRGLEELPCRIGAS